MEKHTFHKRGSHRPGATEYIRDDGEYIIQVRYITLTVNNRSVRVKLSELFDKQMKKIAAFFGDSVSTEYIEEELEKHLAEQERKDR